MSQPMPDAADSPSSESRIRAVIGTVIFLIITWALFFGAAPWGIVYVESWLLWPHFQLLWLQISGVIIFVLGSALNINASLVMALHGDRTPLPNATAGRLVVTGPYKTIRNPITVAGLAQGLAVGVMWGSYSIVVCMLIYVGIWFLIIRPAEERSLEAYFGDEYRAYKKRIHAWWPFSRLK